MDRVYVEQRANVLIINFTKEVKHARRITFLFERKLEKIILVKNLKIVGKKIMQA